MSACSSPANLEQSLAPGAADICSGGAFRYVGRVHQPPRFLDGNGLEGNPRDERSVSFQYRDIRFGRSVYGGDKLGAVGGMGRGDLLKFLFEL